MLNKILCALGFHEWIYYWIKDSHSYRYCRHSYRYCNRCKKHFIKEYLCLHWKRITRDIEAESVFEYDKVESLRKVLPTIESNENLGRL